jgi:hypothetical protein
MTDKREVVRIALHPYFCCHLCPYFCYILCRGLGASNNDIVLVGRYDSGETMGEGVEISDWTNISIYHVTNSLVRSLVITQLPYPNPNYGSNLQKAAKSDPLKLTKNIRTP